MKASFYSILILAVFQFGCAEFLSGMSLYNASMGAECSSIVCETYGYDKNAESWIRGQYFSTEETRENEKNWVLQKQQYYLYKNFGTYYETSPITRVEYKFNVICESYY